MACNPHRPCLSHSVGTSIASLSSPLLLPTRLHLCSRHLLPTPIRVSSRSVSAARFTWDDVVLVSDSQHSSRNPVDLRGFFEKIRVCNRGLEKQSDFLLFVTEDQTVGYIHKGFFDDHLKRFSNVFIPTQDNFHVMLHPVLRTPNERIRAVRDAVKCLGEVVILGIREDLLLQITKLDTLILPSDMDLCCSAISCCIILWGTSAFLAGTCSSSLFWDKGKSCLCILHKNSSLEISRYQQLKKIQYSLWQKLHLSSVKGCLTNEPKVYGVFMNGYTERNGQKCLWIGKRSQLKPTYPGMLDLLVGGGLPHRIACKENLMKECQKEAGIPRSISEGMLDPELCQLVLSLMVILMGIDTSEMFYFVMIKNSLKISFLRTKMEKWRASDAYPFHRLQMSCGGHTSSRQTSLVIIDFLFRHGYISPGSLGYLELLQSLKSGDCS